MIAATTTTCRHCGNEHTIPEPEAGIDRLSLTIHDIADLMTQADNDRSWCQPFTLEWMQPELDDTDYSTLRAEEY